ncbi:hypothetical protein ACQP1G_29140 [Nocardia sp. CA-107356]|uniref:hypothetical protein n=1 Tax=Nocardia sp. CA-107356 TaxID=3239972 RepID=UPI003D9412F9
MHQTALPRGMQITAEPKMMGSADTAGVVTVAGLASADARGAATKSRGTAVAVAATILNILVDISSSFDRIKFVNERPRPADMRDVRLQGVVCVESPAALVVPD